jgi:UDP-3-O-[3-hydroxymyristoyl] glucosamine N-acyltransferase
VRVTVQQLATLIHGQVHGDSERVILAARPLSTAGPDDITFVESERYARHLKTCRAGAAIVPASLVSRQAELAAQPDDAPTFIQVDNPLAAFIAIVRHLHGREEPPPHGIDPLASVHPTAMIGSEASIFPFAVLGEGSIVGARCRIHSGAVIGRHCRIGDDVVLHPHAVLYDHTILGNRVTIHANAVLGADGFGYRLQDGQHVKVPQFGWVEVGDDVEIGAGTTIDRGTFEATRIGEGTKIDNLVQIGHNCQIGRHNLLVSQVGIAGSCSTGDYVVVAGQAGIADHVRLHDRSQIGARSGVARDVPAGERVLGTPATPERQQKRIMLCLERLPALCRDVRQIKQQLQISDEDRGSQSDERKVG